MGNGNSNGQFAYDFEEPVKEIDSQIRELEEDIHSVKDNADAGDVEIKLKELEVKRGDILAQIVENLTPYQRVKLARHPERPQSRTYIKEIFDDFVELHGDRRYGDDKAIVTGFAMLNHRKVMVIAQQKGRETKEKLATNFGMPQPEGYRKALLKMQLAEKFKIPVVCIIDTPGAAPAVEAEERGQGMAIAENIFKMAGLRVPIVTVITGEGCSGGALGIGVGDRHGMLENAYYSVISPEGCAAILFHDSSKADEAARALKITASDMLEFGVVDTIIPEPLGGAHRNPKEAASHISSFLEDALEKLSGIPVEQMIQERYKKYRAIGNFAAAE